ncbi:pantothenate transporter [Karstenula rhodostoma CBS 690.94]|uniref:Pantothenate transporter n=1 Tax=Karstenula rhodostoma CBS 690.94 TaxID=1392251 RepID=A0A9P4UGS7_9PLEO|nr:pantothenate transporter [Karstenula rhodostoma CBS 690.94]
MSTSTKRAAVIGAGISGIVSAAHLRNEGLDVTVYERSSAAGGVWYVLYDERKPLEPSYPSVLASKGEIYADDPALKLTETETEAVRHAPPGPCYVGLKNNVGTRLLTTTLNPFPAGTEDHVSHSVLRDYIQDTAIKTGVERITHYDTEVKNLSKVNGKWKVETVALERQPTGNAKPKSTTSTFDVVVVASGHYHAPRVPDIPGIGELKRQFPTRIQHSKGYRTPERFANRNVLLIGASVSSTDIARELGPVASTIYQSHRGGAFDLPASILPENATRIEEVVTFELPKDNTVALDEGEPLPVTIKLKSGQTLCGIHDILICTGYHITVPFLPDLHSDNTAAVDASPTTLVTDGTQIHNLHKDIFYIPDPSLVFIGVPYFTATFTLFEFQAMVAAKVLAGKVQLPSEKAMRTEYKDRVALKGYGKTFHSLREKEVEYVNELLEFANPQLDVKLLGHTEVWHAARGELVARMKAMFAGGDGTVRELGVTCAPPFPARTPTSTRPSRSPDELPQVIEASEEVKQKPRKWYYYLWDTLDKPKEERWFMFKLDAALLTFASLGYFIKYLDQTNINSAFVSGMKEDLGLYKNQLNYMQTCWTVGYVIGELPSNMMLTRFRPSRWIPCMEMIWAVLTFCLARANSATTIYVLRFFIGLAESTFYPGMQYIIGSWYRKEELAKRSCIFHASSALGIMFSGYLMAAVYKLGGRDGMAGWQWLFIVDGVISLPIAIAGFWFIPDVPEIAKPWYLTEEEVKFAQKRMQLEGRQERKPYTKAKFKKILTSWHIYALTALYVFFNNGGVGAAPVFQQYLKASTDPKYTVSQINVYPTIQNGVQVVSTLAMAWISDGVLKGARWPMIVLGGCVNIMTGVSLAVWNIPVKWKWACLSLTGMAGAISGLCMAWAHEICTHDNEERAIVIASMNEIAYVLQAWLPLIVWQQVDAPEYRKGFITVSCLSCMLIGTALTIRVLHAREVMQRRHEEESDTSSAQLDREESSEKVVDLKALGQ